MTVLEESRHTADAAQEQLREAAAIAAEVATGIAAVAALVMWRSEAATRFRGSADELSQGLRELARRCDDDARAVAATVLTLMAPVG
jgi:uncharacterized protein YukE